MRCGGWGGFLCVLGCVFIFGGFVGDMVLVGCIEWDVVVRFIVWFYR